MSIIPVVENPRRRRRRHRLTAKQRAAGFGGRRRVRHRRNPALAALTNPRRRHRRRRGGFSVRHVVRRRRNPAGGLLGMFNFQDSLWLAGGMVGSRALPGFIKKVWPALPTEGPMGYATKLASALALGFLVKMGTRSPQRAQQVVNGAVALVIYDAFSEYIGPKIGLSGLGAFVSQDELSEVTGMGRFIDTPGGASLSGLGRYGDMSTEILSA